MPELKDFKFQMWFPVQVLAAWLAEPPANGPGVPPGSYLDSCRGCRIDGLDLVCTHCRNAAQAAVRAELRLAAWPLVERFDIEPYSDFSSK